MTKVYIAGPITGVSDYAERFSEVETGLRKRGFQVMSPHILPEGFPWDAYMPICYAMMEACDTIYMLPGWRESKGATLEHDRAVERRMTVVYA